MVEPVKKGKFLLPGTLILCPKCGRNLLTVTRPIYSYGQFRSICFEAVGKMPAPEVGGLVPKCIYCYTNFIKRGLVSGIKIFTDKGWWQ